MNGNASRLELQIDVFELKNQVAQAIPTLTPVQLVAAILAEFGGLGYSSNNLETEYADAERQSVRAKFRRLEYLGDDPQRYYLIQANGRQPLDDGLSIEQQCTKNDHLILVERYEALPVGTQPPTRPIYLREQTTGKVYRLPWQPAIIGRASPKQEHNDWLVVDLTAYPNGLRVSRQHAQVIEADDQFYVELLAENNPLAVRDSQGHLNQVQQQRHPLHAGDTIILEGSQIALKFLVRDQEPAL